MVRFPGLRQIVPPLVLVLGGCSGKPAQPAAGTVTSSAAPASTVLGVAGVANAHVSLAAEGRSVVAAWSAAESSGTNIYVARSDDGGGSFGAPRRVNDVDGDASVNGEAPPRVAIAGRSVHVLWISKRDGVSVLRTAASGDGGLTFTAVRHVTPAGVTGARGWENLALSPDGAVHAVWLDGRNATAHEHHGGMRQDILHATWRGLSAVVETPIAANVCFCCKTAIVARGDALIVAWRHLFPGGVRDIAVARADPAGTVFSEPSRVSADNWQIDACPDDGPAIAMDAAGTLHVAWPTMVETGGRKSMGVFHATSTDRGRTFSPRRRVDTGDGSAAHPAIALDAGGRAVVAWDEMTGGSRRIRVRAGEEAPVTVSEGRIGSYPVVVDSGGVAAVAWTDQSDAKSVIRVARLGLRRQD